MQENRIKKCLREGRPALGMTLHSFATRELPQILDFTNLDWVMIDMEHTGWSIDTVADLIMWFKSTSIATIVRPSDNVPHLLTQIMASGAHGVQVANIESADDARAIVDSVMYPPLGRRGLAFASAAQDFKRPKASEMKAALSYANEQASIVAMIESVEGLERVDEIAAVEGIDMIQPSSQDLTLSLGIPGQYDHPTYRDALRKVAEACRRHNKAAKVNPHSERDVAENYALGYRVLGIKNSADLFQDAVKAGMERIRANLAGQGAPSR